MRRGRESGVFSSFDGFSQRWEIFLLRIDSFPLSRPGRRGDGCRKGSTALESRIHETRVLAYLHVGQEREAKCQERGPKEEQRR